MPKSKAKSGKSAWSGPDHVLSKKARKDLAQALGYDLEIGGVAEKLDRTFQGIEHTLGFYPGAVDALDNAPRPLDYRNWCIELHDVARQLLLDLISIPPRFEEELATEGADRETTMAQVGKLCDAILAVERKYPGGETRGNKRKIALRSVVAALRKIFQREYVGDKSPREERGAITKLSPRERQEERFVIAALEDGKIEFSGNIRRLFDDDEKGSVE